MLLNILPFLFLLNKKLLYDVIFFSTNINLPYIFKNHLRNFKIQGNFFFLISQFFQNNFLKHYFLNFFYFICKSLEVLIKNYYYFLIFKIQVKKVIQFIVISIVYPIRI